MTADKKTENDTNVTFISKLVINNGKKLQISNVNLFKNLIRLQSLTFKD